ncbi:MAG: TIGR00159 family protein [Planctomycetes bacterium]|nr:TIGR00159 family protein [Planctomycetota bacterium]
MTTRAVPPPPQDTLAEGLGVAAEWWPTLLEIAIFAALIYVALRFLWSTRGSVLIRGLGLLLAVLVVGFVLLIQTFELKRLLYVVEQLAPSVVLGLVIVFQPEIRRAIVQLGDSSIFRRFFRRDTKIVPRLLRAIARLSKERIGALIAIERDATLAELAEGGITIDAELNSYLIESIFFPKSALHDGGVIVRNDRIVAASCLFPLSQSPDLDKRLGTRHRAALGLAEETDAFVVVVSEETGRISAASGGALRCGLTLEELEEQLDAALGRKQPA